MYYSLDPVTHELTHHDDVRRWALELAGNRTIEKTMLEHGVLVSTVFLGLDHDFGSDTEAPDYQPLVFETMVFGPPLRIGVWDEYSNRYRSYEEAVAGHAATVKNLEDYLSKGFRFRNLPLALKEWYRRNRDVYLYWKFRRDFGNWPRRRHDAE